MLYSLYSYIVPHEGLDLLNGLGFRTFGALATAFCLFLLSGDAFITFCKSLFASGAREFLPEGHKKKAATPTMGGLLIYMIVAGTILLWSDLSQGYVWLFLLNYTFFAAFGFYDDWCKVMHKRGISARAKSLLQFIGSAMIIGLWLYCMHPDTTIALPIFSDLLRLDVGFCVFALWAMFVMIGASNAVNLTDGLDGLATSSLIPVFSIFTLIAFLAVQSDSAQIFITLNPTPELAVIGAAFIGSCLGFLWYNAYPAEVFMGDVGSLSLGAALAFMALMLKQETLLPIAGGIFVIEALSVMLQVFYYRRTKQRLFRMAPIHHHFELQGWSEAKITTRFTIITCMLCVLALALLLFR